MTSTPELRQIFKREGISVREWATERGYSPRTVYAVIRGELQATRGVSHRIAVDLGLKAAPIEPLLRKAG